MSAISGTVKVPGLGDVKKVYLLGGVGVVAVIVAVAYYRHRNATPAATDVTTNPVTTTDTGYDTGAGGSSGGSNGGSASGSWPWGYDAAGNPIPAPVPGGTANPGGSITTNADWTSQAIALLEGGGVTDAVASGAITGVLGGVGVTSDQEAMFLRAVGVLGDPPQGYPRPIRLVSPPADPAPAPAPTPEPAPAPDTPAPTPAPAKPPTATAGKKAPAKVTGLKAAAKTTTTVSLTWNSVPGARGYTVYRNGARIITVTYAAAKMTGLRANTSYTFAVQTVGSDGQVSALSSINVTTSKAPALTSLNVSKTVKK